MVLGAEKLFKLVLEMHIPMPGPSSYEVDAHSRRGMVPQYIFVANSNVFSSVFKYYIT